MEETCTPLYSTPDCLQQMGKVIILLTSCSTEKVDPTPPPTAPGQNSRAGPIVRGVASPKEVSMEDLPPLRICRVSAWVGERCPLCPCPSRPEAGRRAALRSKAWESCFCPSSAATLQRVAPIPCLDSTVELDRL